MHDDRPSQTAAWVAAWRGLAPWLPEGGQLASDPFGLAFTPAMGRPLIDLAARAPSVTRRLLNGGPLARMILWLQLRTRSLDDLMLAFVRAGGRQVVLLGAGFDCRAHRLPSLAAARVFEVDHPDTLAAKRARLAALDAGSVDGRVTYAGADLNRQALDAVLTAAGVDRAARTFFIWEGVTNYLTATAVDATLRAVAGWAPGSLLLFTYVHRGVIDGSTIFADNVRLKRVLAGAGEPWTFGLEPREVRAFLAARGFELLEDLGAEQYRARYLGAVGAHQRGYQFYRAALARVQPICA